MNRKPMRDRNVVKQPRLEWPGGIVPEWARAPAGNKRRGKGKDAGKRERLQKVMAQSGFGSRRNIEILIAQGHVTVNGQPAKLGDSVGPGDKVKLDDKVISLRYGEQLPRVLLYHKPAGEIVSRDDPDGRPTVFDKLPKVNNGRWVSVGRLDFNTEGLLVFTTNGELANRMTHPRYEVEREYAVRVMGEITPETGRKLLETGVDIDGEMCTFVRMEDRGGEGSNHWYHVVLTEGKNREVRRMMEAVGLMVSRLIRVRFGTIELPGFLKRGMMKELEEEPVQELMAAAGMNESAEEAESEEGENDNIGNRIDRNPLPVEREYPDDDFGNRAHPSHARAEPDDDEVNGNRGTYVPGGAEPAQSPRDKGRRGGKNFRPRGERDGNVAQPQGGPPAHVRASGQGHPPHGKPPGKRHKHKAKHGGKGPPQGQPRQPRQPGPAGQPGQQGAPVPAQAGAEGAPPAAGGGGQPGQGKGRGRRHKHRNRQRGGAGAGPRGDAQPVNNGNNS